MAKPRRPRPQRARGQPGQPARTGRPQPSRDERALREQILEFTYQERFRAEFGPALRRYFGREAVRGKTICLDEMDVFDFQEWYINDYVTSEKERIIDLFEREVGPRLPPAQRKMLDDWRRTDRLRLFEVLAVEPGVGETVQDLLSGEVLEVHDISASRALCKWMIILARPLLTEGRLHFAGTLRALPPMDKQEMLDFARQLWQRYRLRHPQASLDDFYRDHSLDLLRRMGEIANAPPPPVYTAEGHPLHFCRARFAVADPLAVRALLDEAEEFNFAGTSEEDPLALHYNWLLRGRSQVPEASKPQRGIMATTTWTAGVDGPSYRSLGDVLLWPWQLELRCISKERLRAGKSLLKEILGRSIRHLGDEHADMEALLEDTEELPSPRPRRPLSKAEQSIQRRMLAEQRAAWLNTPMPALGGKTPREAAGDPSLRGELEEILKSIEYMEEQKRRAGELAEDIADLRRELGLSPS